MGTKTKNIGEHLYKVEEEMIKFWSPMLFTNFINSDTVILCR